MVGMEIDINGVRHCLAALQSGVVSAFVVHTDLPHDPPEQRPSNTTPPTSLSVTGNTSARHAVHWNGIAEGIRHEMTIRAVDTDTLDPPTANPRLPDWPEHQGQ